MENKVRFLRMTFKFVTHNIIAEWTLLSIIHFIQCSLSMAFQTLIFATT